MTEILTCTSNFFPELCGVNVILDPTQDVGVASDCALVVGQKLASGSAPVGKVVKVDDRTRGADFGVGSNLNSRLDVWRAMAPTATLYVFVLPESGTASTATIEFAATATATDNATVYLWVNGRRYDAPYNAATETPANLVFRFVGMINQAQGPALVASADASAPNKLKIVTANKGKIESFLDVRSDYDRRPDLISNPAITVGIDVEAGTGTPDLSPILGADSCCQFVDNPYTDDANLAIISDFLCQNWSSQGCCNPRASGVYFGDVSDSQTKASGVNNAFMSYPLARNWLTPPSVESSVYTANLFNATNSSADLIAASLSGTVMPDTVPPELADSLTSAEKAELVNAGVGYFDVIDETDSVIIGRAVTTYTRRDNGTIDRFLRDVPTVAIHAFLNCFFRTELGAKYSGYALRTDGTVGAANGTTKVVTLGGIRNYIANLGQSLSDENVIQDLQGFIKSIDVALDEDTGCVRIQLSPTLVTSVCCMNVFLRTQ